jgi:hypothetical protein
MLNPNTLTAGLAGLVVGGALADALEGIYVLATGTAGVGAAIGVLYGIVSRRRRRRARDPLAWGADQSPDLHTSGLVGGAIGAIIGLLLGILDALIGG